MGKKPIDEDRKRYSVNEQVQGREDLDGRQYDRPLNQLKEDMRRDENPPGEAQDLNAEPQNG